MTHQQNFVTFCIRVATLTATLFLTGCLVNEKTEYTLTLNSDGKSGTFSVIQRHVESDAQDTASQRTDFDELLANWQGDRYLLDQMDKGLYVKERSLAREHGVLVWKETSIFSDIVKLIPLYSPGDTLRFPLHNIKGLEITTNGKLVAMQDSAVILWPPHAMHFELTTKTLGFAAASHFGDRFLAVTRK